MGMIGRFLDSLTDDERDAIIEHPDPRFNGDRWWVDAAGGWSTPWDNPDGCGCLVGTAIDQRCRRLVLYPVAVPWLVKIETGIPRWEWHEVGRRFPELTRRFGPERIWRVVKARAARANRVPVEPSPEPVKAIR